MTNKTITIFGSSLPVEGDAEFQFAYGLGKKLAQNNFNVCTGGYRGIMHAASKGAKEAGGEAIGITVDLWGAAPSEFLTKEIRCKTLPERIEKLIDAGDGFVVLQGGTGTLLELAFVWELMNKKLIERKPVLCHSRMWREIVGIMENQIAREKRKTGLIHPCGTVDEIISFLKTHIK